MTEEQITGVLARLVGRYGLGAVVRAACAKYVAVNRG